MSKRNKILIGLGTTFALLIISTYIITLTYVDPKINFSINISNIDEDNIARIKGNNNDKIALGFDKFKKINMELNVDTFPIVIKNIEIEQPALAKLISESNEFIDESGGSFSYPDKHEYSEGLIVILENSTEDDLRTFLGEEKIKITWTTIFNKSESRILYLKDFL